MKGGRLIGARDSNNVVSRLSGLTLCWFRGLPTHDATNAFKTYDRAMLDAIPIESTGGFELSLEITVKAFLAGYTISENAFYVAGPGPRGRPASSSGSGCRIISSGISWHSSQNPETASRERVCGSRELSRRGAICMRLTPPRGVSWSDAPRRFCECWPLGLWTAPFTGDRGRAQPEGSKAALR